MNSKYLVILFVFGVLCTFTKCGRIVERNDASDSDSDSDEVSARAINEYTPNDSDSADDESLREEKRAIHDFLQNGDEASDFLEQSRRFLISDTKSHMKDAKKSYEEKCERLLHPRYCPDLATWPAWNQAFNAATGKK